MKNSQKTAKKSFFCLFKRLLMAILILALVVLVFFVRNKLEALNDFQPNKPNLVEKELNLPKKAQKSVKIVENESKSSKKSLDSSVRIAPDTIDETYLLNKQIADLKSHILQLEKQIAAINLDKTLPSLLVSYVNLDRKINSGDVFVDDLRHMQVLAKDDLFLTNKLLELEDFTHLIKSGDEIAKDLEDLIIKLLKQRNLIQENSTIWQKLKNLFFSNITIRSTQIKPNKGISKRDYLILKVQKAVKLGDFEQLFDVLVQFDGASSSDLQDVLSDIAIILQVRKISDDIFDYLNELT